MMAVSIIKFEDVTAVFSGMTAMIVSVIMIMVMSVIVAFAQRSLAVVLVTALITSRSEKRGQGKSGESRWKSHFTGFRKRH
jgi:uncharacterized membrane protein YgcG